jgi:hypothetical protein
MTVTFPGAIATLTPADELAIIDAVIARLETLFGAGSVLNVLLQAGSVNAVATLASPQTPALITAASTSITTTPITATLPSTGGSLGSTAVAVGPDLTANPSTLAPTLSPAPTTSSPFTYSRAPTPFILEFDDDFGFDPSTSSKDEPASVSAGFIVGSVGVVLVVALVVKLRANKSNNTDGDRNVAALPDIYNEPLYDTLNPRRRTVATTAIDDAIPNPTYDAPIIYDATGCRPAPATAPGRVTDSSNDDAKAVYSLADPSDDAGAGAAAADEQIYGLRPGVVYDTGSNSARGSLVYDMGNSEDAVPEEDDDDDDDDDGVPVGRMTSTITSMASIMTNWGDEETTYDNPRIEQQEPDEWADVDGLPLRGRTKVLRAPSDTDTDGTWSRIPGIVRRESMV